MTTSRGAAVLLICELLVLSTAAHADSWHRLEDEADKAVHQQPPNYQLAIEKLRRAIKDGNGPQHLLLRIGEWSLRIGACEDARHACSDFLGFASGDYADRAKRCIDAAADSCGAAGTPTTPPVPIPLPSSAPGPEPKGVAMQPAPCVPTVPLIEGMPIPRREYFRCMQYASRQDVQGCFYQLFTQTQPQQWDVAVINDLTGRLARDVKTLVPSFGYRTPRRNTALWSAGLTLWLSAMIPPLVYGPLNVQGNPYPGLNDVYYSLMIPIVGPFISGLWLPQRVSNPQEAWINYSLPWILADGIAQIAGLTMFAVGLQKHSPSLSFSSRPTKVTLSVVPYSTINGGGVAMIGRF